MCEKIDPLLHLKDGGLSIDALLHSGKKKSSLFYPLLNGDTRKLQLNSLYPCILPLINRQPRTQATADQVLFPGDGQGASFWCRDPPKPRDSS